MSVEGRELTAEVLAHLGIAHVFGIVGIPVIELSMSLQQAGVNFYGMRNEQAASYAAGVAGYMTGKPGVCVVVSGPGMVHAIAGLANAKENCWPMILIGGSSDTNQDGMGAFQESNQVEWARPYVKYSARPDSIARIPFFLEQAYRHSIYGRPGPVYIDIPGNLLRGSVSRDSVLKVDPVPPPPITLADPVAINNAANIIRTAKRPLIIIGKGAAYSRAEQQLRQLVDTTQLPFLPTPMGKGVVPDDHPLCVSAARTAALGGADVVLVVGARLNWMLHFGQPPRFDPAVKFIMVDIHPESMGTPVRHLEALVGSCPAVVDQLRAALGRWKYSQNSPFWDTLRVEKNKNESTIKQMLQADTERMNYFQVFNAVTPYIKKDAIIVSEGANTMDISRTMVLNSLPRCRLDAGTYGTMGVGMGFAFAAAVLFPEKQVICIQGDSAFGFSAMELEPCCRYKCHNLTVVIVNNGGIYQGLPAEFAGKLAKAPRQMLGRMLPPTVLTHNSPYEKIVEIFGGKGYPVDNQQQASEAMKNGVKEDAVAIVHCRIDPKADRKPQKHAWLTLEDENKSKL